MSVVRIVFLYLLCNSDSDAAVVEIEPLPQLIEEAGYPVETHVVDSNGYLLTVHRLPQPPTQQAATSVMLVHGLFCSAVDWVMQGRGRALGYLLHDAGLDVWLPNLRGTTNSSRHKRWKPSQQNFWNFTFEEMGTEDIFSLTDYILKLTGNEKINLISNSMGGASILVGLSEKPEYNKKYHQLIMYGPNTSMNNTYGAIRQISALKLQIQKIAESLKMSHFPNSYFEGLLNYLNNVCRKQKYEVNFCIISHNWIIENESLIDFPLFQKFIEYYPTPTSMKNLLHLLQTIGVERFAKFDYGINNIKIYGTPRPPPYDLGKVTAPVFLVHVEKDNLVPPQDIELLKSRLPNVIKTLYITKNDFGHSSFLFHPNISEVAYKPIVTSIKNFNGKIPLDQL